MQNLRRFWGIAIIAGLILGSTTVVQAGLVEEVGAKGENAREGFVIGLGVGVGPASYKQTIDLDYYDDISSDRESKMALQTDFKIGMCATPQLQLYWMSKVAWFSEEFAYGMYYDYYLDEWVYETSDEIVTVGIGGLGVSYYFAPQAPSPYLIAGIGFSTFATPFNSDIESQIGFGLAGGLGFEFAPHFSVELVGTYGEPSKDELTTSVYTAKLTLNWTHY